MKSEAPTATQKAAAALAAEGTGVLARRHGGFWMIPGEPTAHTYPDAGRYALTPTIRAMIRKGMVTVTKTSGNGLGQYAIEVTLSPTNQ